MSKLMGFVLVLLIAGLTLVLCQDDELEGSNESNESYMTIHHDHDSSGEDSDAETGIDHRIGDAVPVPDLKNDKFDASPSSADQKPAESLLSMSIDPLSDGSLDPDLKAILANAEAQDDVVTSQNNRVPHSLNLAVGSASNYQNAPAQQFQYAQPQGGQLTTSPTLSEEHKKAIAQLAFQQQQTIAGQANEQRDVEQLRFQQQYLQQHGQEQQYLQQQPQQIQHGPSPVPHLQQQQHQIPSQGHNQQLYNPSVAPQSQASPQTPLAPLAQFPQPSVSPQLFQYQQPSIAAPTVGSQFSLHQNPSIAPHFQHGHGQQLLHQHQHGIHQAQPQQLPTQGPTQPSQIVQSQQLNSGPSQTAPIQLPQQVYQGPSQAPVHIVQNPVPQHVFQNPSHAPPTAQQQQIFPGPSQSPLIPQQHQPQQQQFQGPTNQPPVGLQSQVYPGPSQAPQIPAQQQQQVYQNPSQIPPFAQPQQIYQNPTQQPTIQQYQPNPIQYPTQSSVPISNQIPAQQQQQQFAYQGPSSAPVQEQALQQHHQVQIQSPTAQPSNQQSSFPAPTQFTAQQGAPALQYQQQQQPTRTPQPQGQYHVQVSPAPNQSQTQSNYKAPSTNTFGNGFPENTLALGSENSVSSQAPKQTPSAEQQTLQNYQRIMSQLQNQPAGTPPKNIQQILSQQNNQPEISEEQSEFPQQTHVQDQLEGAYHKFQQEIAESSTSYPQTHEIQQEYEKAINNSGHSVAQQDLADASQELTNYAQTIEERAAQILENFRRQVLGNRQPSPTPEVPPSTTAPEEIPTQHEPDSSMLHQLTDAITNIDNAYLQPIPEEPPQTPSEEPNQEMPQQNPTQMNQIDPSQTPISHESTAAPTQQGGQNSQHENELVQEGSASIQKEVVHGNGGGGLVQLQSFQQNNLLQYPQPGQQIVGLNPQTLGPNQAMIQQVIETQAIQQNSLQQLWQLYQQQQQLLQQTRDVQKQRQTPVQYAQVAPPQISNGARLRNPAAPPPVYLQQQISQPAGFVQTSSPVTFPPEIHYPPQPLNPSLINPNSPEATLYYQQFIGPVPAEVKQQQQLPPTHNHGQIPENPHYTIYKVKEDHAPLNSYRNLGGILPEQQQHQVQVQPQPQIIETSQQPLSSPQLQYSPQAYAQEQSRTSSFPYAVNNYQQQRQQVSPQELQGSGPGPSGPELVPLEEVGRNEDASTAYLQLPAHEQTSQAESLLGPGPGPTQLPHSAVFPQQQQQIYNPDQYTKIQNGDGSSDFYQVQSQSYVMPGPNYPPPGYHHQQQQPLYEIMPSNSQDSYATTYQQNQEYPSQWSQYQPQPQRQQQPKIPGAGSSKVIYPKPVVTSYSKPAKKLRKNNHQYSMIANMEYRPEVLLPGDEAAFAAHQAKVLGGAAFRDEEYNNYQQQQQPHSGKPTPTSVAESFGFSLKPLLRLGKLSAKAFKQGFNDKMHRLNEANTARRTSSNAKSDDVDSVPAPSQHVPIRSRKHHHNQRYRQQQQQQQQKSTLEQIFSPRAGDMEIKEVVAPASSVGKKSRPAVLADIIADGELELDLSPPLLSES